MEHIKLICSLTDNFEFSPAGRAKEAISVTLLGGGSYDGLFSRIKDKTAFTQEMTTTIIHNNQP